MDNKLQELLQKHTQPKTEAAPTPAPTPVVETKVDAPVPSQAVEPVQGETKEIVLQDKSKLDEIKNKIQQAKKKKAEMAQLQEQEAKRTEEINQLKERAKYADKFEGLKKDKTLIFKIAQEAGITDEDIVNFSFENRKENGFETQSQPKLNLEEIEKNLEVKIQDKILKQMEEQRNQGLVKELVSNVRQFIHTNEEKFPILSTEKNADKKVLDLMGEYWNTERKVLSYDDACSFIENSYEEEYENKIKVLKRSSKLKKYFGNNELPENETLMKNEVQETQNKGVVNPLSQKDTNSISRSPETKLTGEEKFKMLMEKHFSKT